MKYVKKGLSILLSLVMVISMMTGVGSAADTNITENYAKDCQWQGTDNSVTYATEKVGTKEKKGIYSNITFFNMTVGGGPYYLLDYPNWNNGKGALTANASNTIPTWKIEDTTIVSMEETRITEQNYIDEDNSDKTGCVRLVPHKTGTTTLTWTGGTTTAPVVKTITLYVRSALATTMNIAPTSADLQVGATSQITCSIDPTNAAKDIIYTSLNPEVATVSESGLIKAVGTGSTQIQVLARSGNSSGLSGMSTYTKKLKKSVTVNVSNGRKITAGDWGNWRTEYQVGEVADLPYSNYTCEDKQPAAASDFTFKSDDSSVVSVSPEGKMTALKEGTTYISMTPVNTSSTVRLSSIQVTVIAKTPSVIPVTGITLDPTSCELKVGKTQPLEVTVAPAEATNKKFTWTSSNEAVATINENGYVRGISPGTALITATTEDGGKTATCSVTVKQQVESISLNQTALEMVEGGTTTLSATVLPANATNKAVTWTSSKTSVVTVQNGLVTAVKEGEAVVTATAADGSNVKATCRITVLKKEIKVTGITLSKESVALKEGEITTLSATVAPANATNKAVTWTSSNEDVVTVNNGSVTAVKDGEAVVTATAADGSNVKATCTVTVSKKDTTVKVTDITLSKESVALKEGETATLTATVKPDNATNRAVTWQSSDTNVVTVENGKVTAKKKGTATITAASTDGTGISASCSVTVTVPVKGIAFSENTIEIDRNNETAKTVKLVFNNGASVPENTGFTCTSSDETVAQVTSDSTPNADGSYNITVTAKKSGTVTITAKTEENGYSAYCTVKITKPVTSIAFSGNPMKKGETQDLSASLQVTPADADNTGVAWSSSNTAIATVSSAGVLTVTADSGSTEDTTVTITATAKDGSGVSAACEITVSPTKVTDITLSLSEMPLLKGATADYLIATVTPENATVKTVEWSSSNTQVATVDATGKITAVGNQGETAKITAVSTDGSNVTSNECTVTIVENAVSVTGVNIKVDNTVQAAGSQIQIKDKETKEILAEVTPDNATTKGVKWQITGEDVLELVTQSSGGCMVKGLKEGTATLTALAIADNSKQASIQIEVVAQKVTEITLNGISDQTLKLGETYTPDGDGVVILPATATNKEVKWTSSDANVAGVDKSTGKVTAASVGTATITVAAKDGSGCTASYQVTVEKIPVESITVSPQTKSVKVNDTFTVAAQVLPANATDKQVTWSSSDDDVASVDASGVVTAKKEGQASITASADGKSAVVTVTVSKEDIGEEDILPESVTISETDKNRTVGDTWYMSAEVLPANAVNKTVTWSGDNPSVAEVKEDGTVVAKGPGTVTITAATQNGKQASVTVTVKAKGGEETEIQVTRLTLTVESQELSVGQTTTAAVVVEPDNASDKTVTWSSSDETVATVAGENGTAVITAASAGTATITATAGNGVTASVTITVKEAENPNPTPNPNPNPTPTPTPDPNPNPTPTPTPGPNPNPTPTPNPAQKAEQTITVQSSIKKTYGSKAFSLNAKTSGDGTLSYKSSNTKVVKVSPAGKVTISGTGMAVITITASETESYQSQTAAVTITIQPKKAVLKKLSSAKKKSLKITWKKDKKASGYEILLATDKKFKKNKKKITVNSYKTTSKTVKKLKSKKIYYVKIRSYKKVNGKKIYGAYSKVLKLKVK